MIALVAKGVNFKMRDAFNTVIALALREEFSSIIEKRQFRGDYTWRPERSTIISADVVPQEVEPFVAELLENSLHSRKPIPRLNHALLAAVSEGNTVLVNTLLQKGADLSAYGCYEYGRYAHKETHPLEEAASWGYEETLETLLQKAEVIKLSYQYYQEALDTASSMKWESTSMILRAAMTSRFPGREHRDTLRCSGDNYCFLSEQLIVCPQYVPQPTARGKNYRGSNLCSVIISMLTSASI